MAIKTIMYFWGRVCVKGRLAHTVGKRLSKKLGKHHSHITKAYLKHCHHYQRGKINAAQFWGRVQKELGSKASHKHLVQHHVKSRELNKGVIGLIKKQRENNKVMLVTNTYKEYFAHNDKRHGIRKMFDDVVLSYKVGERIPHKKMFRTALKKAKCKPSECVFISDKDVQLKPAKALGMKTVKFKNQAQLKKSLKRLGVK